MKQYRGIASSLWPRKLVVLLALLAGILSCCLVVSPQKAAAEELVGVNVPFIVDIQGSAFTGDTIQTTNVNIAVYAKDTNPVRGGVRGETIISLTPRNDNPLDAQSETWWSGGGTISAMLVVPSANQQEEIDALTPTPQIPGQPTASTSDYQYQVCSITHNVCSDWASVYLRDGTWMIDQLSIHISNISTVGTSNDGVGPTYIYDPNGIQEDPPIRSIICEDMDGSMGWILCIFLNWIDQNVDGLESAISSVLSVDQLYNAGDDYLYKAWAAMRNISLILLIPIMLVMVLGTALNFSMFDAYTVKKALPRMIAAVIFISLSWYICTFLIDLSDIVGGGVLGLIENASGANGPINLRTLFVNTGEGQSTAIAGGIFTGALLGGFAAFGLGALSIGIILSLAVSAALALFIGYLSLAIRLVIILGLLVFSPIFILSWIFPGNDKMWKFWKTSFISMLLLFPIITGAIGIGRVGAYIISTLGTG